MFEIGSSLREARIRQQLAFPEIEAGTKIRQKYLRALEDERFEVLPAHTYVKGFLRAYADYLGLDGQLYVDEYNTRFVSVEDDAPARPRRVQPAARRRAARRLEANVVLLALIAIALVTGLVIVAWKFGGPEGQQVRGLATGTAPTTTTAARPPAEPTVVVSAPRGDTKLEARVGTPRGRLLYSGTLERGQQVSFDEARVFLRLGRPANVDVVVDGRARGHLAPRWGTYVVTRNAVTRYRAGS